MIVPPSQGSGKIIKHSCKILWPGQAQGEPLVMVVEMVGTYQSAGKLAVVLLRELSGDGSSG